MQVINFEEIIIAFLMRNLIFDMYIPFNGIYQHFDKNYQLQSLRFIMLAMGMV